MGQGTSTGMGRGEKTARKGQAAGANYEDFEPLTDWVQEEEHDTIFVNLPEFKKEQIRIEVGELRKLKISGERLISSNNWIRFCHEFRVPDYCNLSKILCVEFTNGILSVTLPKMTTQPSPTKELASKAVKATDTEPYLPPAPTTTQSKPFETQTPPQHRPHTAEATPPVRCLPAAAASIPNVKTQTNAQDQCQCRGTKECKPMVIKTDQAPQLPPKDQDQRLSTQESILKVDTQITLQDQRPSTQESILKVDTQIAVQDQRPSTKESIPNVETQISVQDQRRPTKESIPNVDIQIAVQDQCPSTTKESTPKVDIQIAVQDQRPPTEESRSNVGTRTAVQDQYQPSKQSMPYTEASTPIPVGDQHRRTEESGPPKVENQIAMQDQRPSSTKESIPNVEIEIFKQDHRAPIKESIVGEKADHLPIDKQDQPMRFKESYKHSKESYEYSKGSFYTGLNKPRELNTNVVVAAMVGLALGIGLTYCVKRR